MNRPELSFDEDSPIRPSSPYSASKAAADLLVLSYWRTFGLPVTISRCSNNYGPYQFPEKLIPVVILKALRGDRIPVYGDGRNKRDWLYVTDHCAAIDLILHKGRSGEVYNIGGGCEQSNLEVVRKILTLLGKPDTLISFVPDRPGHDLRYSINAGKARTELNWVPAVDFRAGLQETVEWYLNNQPWLEHILDGSYRNFLPPRAG